MRQEGQTLWSWLLELRELPTPGAPSCRWGHLAEATSSTEDQNEGTLLRRVEPVMVVFTIHS